MQYNSKYDRYVTKGGFVYRYDDKNDKLILCKLAKTKYGYFRIKVSKPKRTMVFVHRLVYETFVGEIPQGFEIDHINTIRDDNRLGNLRCVTHKENVCNPLTIKRYYGNTNGKGNTNKRNKAFSEFGKKYLEHFGYSRYENPKQYVREQKWYINHNKVCRWEVDNGKA